MSRNRPLRIVNGRPQLAGFQAPRDTNIVIPYLLIVNDIMLIFKNLTIRIQAPDGIYLKIIDCPSKSWVKMQFGLKSLIVWTPRLIFGTQILNTLDY